MDNLVVELANGDCRTLFVVVSATQGDCALPTQIPFSNV